jgi:SNF2 family DNA or RNA helicase
MLLDNKKNGKVGEVLKENLKNGSKLSIISGLFSIYGFEALRKELLNVDAVRLLFSKIQLEKDGVFTANFNGLNGDSFERRFQNRLTQSHIAKECSAWLSKKVEIKATTNPHILNQNLFHIENVKDETVAIQGSSNFTSSGLGYSESSNYDMNTCSSDLNSTKELLGWFDSIWNNPDAVYETKELLLCHLDTIIKDNSPEFIYFLTLFNIFKDFLEELDEENIIKIKTGFKDTLIWNKLYKFQRDGVLGAIEKLEKYNGCIIADSVGLGKTFEALAVIKYYELRNDRVLVLCPKRLRENWTIYTVNDKLNTLAGDRFNFDVLNHTDLTRVQGKSGEINLETLNWGNYDLIVIEESHNFRNNNSRKEGFTRYSRLMDDIIKSGVKTKVLMLSATPVNNRMNDLKNQVAFITEGIDDTFVDLGISSIEQTLKNAQARFNQWLDLDEQERQLDILLEKMSFDYFKLLDILTIARSRKHIEKYYDIAEIGKFPERLKPINIKEDIDLEGKFPPLSEINKTIRRLNLSAYSPLKYVKMEKREEYNRKYDIQVKDGSSVFKQVDREQSLIHLMRVNLLKRMESSINSFALTLGKLLYEISNLIERIDAHEEESFEELNIEDIEIDSPEFEAVLIGKKVKVLINDIDAIRWKQDLEDDHEKLTSLLDEARSVDSTRDAKLNKLRTIIENKCNNPINPENKKIIVFTAFADTAHYIYENIAEWAQAHLGIYSSVITGSRPVKTTMPGIKQNLSNLIISFSPRSKEREKIDSTITEEIDILIATDCLSEGQNLQDCDYLINYDIHWNPVRIIQRFGRIDRLGSQNDCVQLLNFWPNMELDEYINLEARVSGRMILLDISATGEENIIEYDEKKKMNDLEYRRKQLQHLQENVVDIEEMSGGVSITDLTLNDFRMDLSQYIKEQSGDFEIAPTGLYAVIANNKTMPDAEIEPGVIFCLKNVSSKIKLESSYAIAPYYLVYVTDNGSVKYNFMQTKKILDLLKKLSLGLHNPDDRAIELLSKSTNNAKDMSLYCSLLESAIYSIIGKTEEKGVESLFSRGGTVLSKDTFQGIEDFEVISYLILK